METPIGISNLFQKILLSCGIFAPLIYLGTDLLSGRLLKGYNFAAQSISELSAIGSPTRSLVVAFTIVADILMIAFGVGVWRIAGQALLPRIVSGLVIGNVVTGLVATLFFPARFGETPVFASPGVIIMFLSVVCFVLAMFFGSMAFDGWLRMLSLAIPVTYILLAILRFATAKSSSAGETVSLVGAQERTMSYSFLLWVIALSIYLLLAFSKGMNATNGVGG